MLKKENLRKNFLRVKQIADQNLGRAEKSEVLSEDLQTVEKRVELVKQICHSTTKKIGGCLQGSGTDPEKRLKKQPEHIMGLGMIESGSLLGTDSIMGTMFQTCGECQTTLAKELLQYEIDVEQQVLNPMQEILDVEIPVIVKCKKQLTKLTLDMDSCKSRWNQAVKQTQVHGANMAATSAKADQVKEEFDESVNKMHQARDQLATEMFNFVAKEADHSQKLVSLLQVQRAYHKRALEALEQAIPKLSEALECNPLKPVYGVPLDEHLRVTGRDIALVLEVCVITLLEGGLEEEGLFRIAGMASKVKKLKNAFDANVIDMEEYAMDLHSVAGALKQYFRELPEPLLTTQLYPDFLSIAKLPEEQRLQQLWTAIRKLPEQNYNNFRYLIKFLSKLAEKSSENKMTPSNIAIVIGPNLLWSEGDNGPNMVTSGTISNMIELFIIHCDWFFPEAVNFHQTNRGTAPPKSPGAVDSHSSVTLLPVTSQHGSISKACGAAIMTAVGPISSHDKAFSDDPISNNGERSPSYQSMNSTSEDETTHTSTASEEIEFGTMESLKANKNSSSDLSEVISDNTDQDAPSTQMSSPPNHISVEQKLSVPSAESEDISPKVQKRIPKKPAPPPPPDRPPHQDRPYSIAVTAMAKSNQAQYQTWPRQAESSNLIDLGNSQEDITKPTKSQPDRPALPDKPPGNAPHRSATLAERHSHSDRPSMPPPERPKIPPPAVPNHQRSASTGSSSHFNPPVNPLLSLSAENDQVFAPIQENSVCLNKTSTL